MLCRGMIQTMHKSLLVLIMALVNFGASTHAAAQAQATPVSKPINACTLITKTEIEEIVGRSFGDGIPGKQKDTYTCTFENGKSEQIVIIASLTPVKRDLSKALEQVKTALPNSKVQEVPGLGDKALLVDNPFRGTMLSVYRAGDTLVVSVLISGERARADVVAEKIARKAFKRF